MFFTSLTPTFHPLNSLMEVIRPIKFTLLVGKYLYYIGIEFSDQSTVCFTEQPEDSSVPALTSDGSFKIRSPSPNFDKRSSVEPGAVVQQGSAGATAEGAQTYEIALEDGEYVVEVWGRLFSRGTYVSSLGIYTNKERAFGPFGNTIGKPFNFIAPSLSHFLHKVTAEGTKYNGYRALKGLAPVWEVVPPRDAPLAYRPRLLAAVLKRLTELKVIVENMSAYISKMANHLPPDEEVLKVLGLSGTNGYGSGSGSSKKKSALKRGASDELAAAVKDHWAFICFRLADDVLCAVEDVRKNYPTTLNSSALAFRLAGDIVAYAQSLREIACAYIEDDDVSFPSYASMMGHSNDIGSKVAFYIIPEANKKLVLAVEKGLLKPGAKIVATPFRRGDDSQLFMFTQNGMIRSLKSGLVLSAPLSEENNLIAGVQVTQEEEEDDPARMFRQRFAYYAQSKSIRVEADLETNPSFYELDVPCLCLQVMDECDKPVDGNGTEEKAQEEGGQGSNETRPVIVSTPLNDRSQKWFFKR